MRIRNTQHIKGGQRLVGQSVPVGVQGLEQAIFPVEKLPEIDAPVAVDVTQVHKGVALFIDHRFDLPAPVLVVIITPAHQPVVDEFLQVIDHAVAVFVLVAKQKTSSLFGQLEPFVRKASFGRAGRRTNELPVPVLGDPGVALRATVAHTQYSRSLFAQNLAFLVSPKRQGVRVRLRNAQRIKEGQRLVRQSIPVGVQGFEQAFLPVEKLPEIDAPVAVDVAQVHVGVALIVDHRPDFPAPILVVIVAPAHQPFVDPLLHVVDHAVAVLVVVPEEKAR